MILDNVFDRFNNTVMEIVELADYDDYENRYNNVITIGTVNGDLQPYSGELLMRDYGLNKECQKRFFCGQNSDIHEGVYLKANDVYYMVVYVAKWDMGLTVMLKEVQL